MFSSYTNALPKIAFVIHISLAKTLDLNVLRWDVLVLPDPGTHITRSSCEETTWSRRRRDRDNRVLVTLEHELGITSSWIPELNSTVLGSGEDPSSVWSEGNGKNKILDRGISIVRL